MADNQSTMKLHILLAEEEKINLTGLLFPDKTELAGLVWISGNDETATVSPEGVVAGVKPGNAKITVRSADSSMEDSVMVLVMGREDTGLRVSILLKPAEKCRLAAVYGDTQGAATWTSSDTAVATVDQTGRVTAAAAGTVLITVRSKDGVMTDQVYVTVRDETPAPAPTGIYGICIDKHEPDPDKRVTYLYDAAGKRPARINYEAGVFDYGDWADVWFVKENKPCMLKYDGTVDYYLNPEDYSKKEDGTDSDVANIDYEGNAMAEFPLIWMKQYEEGRYEYILVSDHQADEDYTAYPYTREDGSIADKLYLRMFEGSFDDVKLPSLAGQTVITGQEPSAEITEAERNGECWTVTAWSEWDMIDSLLRILSKGTDSQSSFGAGNCDASQMMQTGTLNASGQFFGYEEKSKAVKVFHMENWWGNALTYLQGITKDNDYHVLYKMSLPYNYAATNYADSGVTVATHGIQNKQSVGKYGKLPTEGQDDNLAFYCDEVTAIGWATDAFSGGDYDDGLGCGESCLRFLPLDHCRSLGVCLSARPPKTE